MTYRKKLIEVALPLEAINREAVRESYIYRGNPSAVHKWWTQKPLAVARAVLLASILDDPSSRPDEFPTPDAQDRERRRLFALIERLVVWESSGRRGSALQRARGARARYRR
jgi:putative DNA methylase